MRPLLLPVLLLCAACSSPAERASSSPTPATPPPGDDRITLLDPGAHPRRVLRYAIPEGTERTRITYELDMRIDPPPGHPMGPREGLGRIEIELETSSRPVPDRELVDQRIRISSAELADASDEQMFAPFAAISRLRESVFTARLEPAGFYDDRVIPPLPDDEPETAVALDLLLETVFGATPLPAEPIGIGARWEVQRTTTVVGPTPQTSARNRYELVAFDGDAVRLRLRTRQSSQPDPSVTARQIEAQGHGEIRIDLTRTFPEGDAVHEGDADVPSPGGLPPIAMHQRIRMRFAPR